MWSVWKGSRLRMERVIVHYDRRGRVAAVEITDITTL